MASLDFGEATRQIKEKKFALAVKPTVASVNGALSEIGGTTDRQTDTSTGCAANNICQLRALRTIRGEPSLSIMITMPPSLK